MTQAMFLASIINFEQGNIAAIIKTYSKRQSNTLVLNSYLFLTVCYASTRLSIRDLIVYSC
jgi:hypothetical protein